jgi:hypothetical protein
MGSTELTPADLAPWRAQNLRNSAPLQTVLGIDDKRMQKLMWELDEIMRKKSTKAEAFVEIDQITATTTEKMLMSYMLAKRLMILNVPMGDYIIEQAGV